MQSQQFLQIQFLTQLYYNFMATFDTNGLQIDTLNDLTTTLQDKYRIIYGQDIDVSSNTQTGQQIALLAQMFLDIQELIANINASFDPDQASGILLDQRVNLYGIKRQGATFSYVNIELVTDRGLSLQGLDADANNINGSGFTVSNDTGDQFILLDSQNPSAAGTYTYTFRSKALGAINPSINTITNINTITVGVVSVNNPSAPTTIGVNEESDAILRQRAKNSVGKSGQASLDSIKANIANLNGVVSVEVYENDSNITDGDGLVAHSIYVIVEGGADADIASVIYKYKTAGCNLNGSTQYTITNDSGKQILIRFDRPSAKNLYVKFNIKPTVSGQSFNIAGIKQYIINNIAYNIGSPAETSALTAVAIMGIASTGGGGVPLDLQISKDGSAWADYLDVDLLKEKWTLATARIDITEL